MTEQQPAYDRLLAALTEHGASFRFIDHPEEGRTEIVSGMRGHPVGHAAKCIILIVKQGKKRTRYVLAVVPGDARLDLGVIKSLYDATYVGFASSDVAEDLAHSVVGTVLPFAFDERLELIVDPAVTEPPEIFFNAARLDRSVALRSADYARIARPRFASIAKRG